VRFRVLLVRGRTMIRRRMNIVVMMVDVRIRMMVPMVAVDPAIVLDPDTTIGGAIVDTTRIDITCARVTSARGTTAQQKLQGASEERAENYFAGGLHWRVAGLALSTYSTRPTVPPVGSEMIANRLP
jgi:hypothetical protein